MDDYEYEEEKAVIMVELQGVFDSDSLWKEQQSFKILGLETEEPVFQIGNYVFSGEYEDSSGTLVFFDKPQEGDEVEESPCISKTDKKLTMRRVFLEKKSQESEPPLVTDKPPDEISHILTEESCSEVLIESNIVNNVRSNLSPLTQESAAKDKCDGEVEVPMEMMDVLNDETVCNSKQTTLMDASSNGNAISEQLQKKRDDDQNLDANNAVVGESETKVSVAQEAYALSHLSEEELQEKDDDQNFDADSEVVCESEIKLSIDQEAYAPSHSSEHLQNKNDDQNFDADNAVVCKSETKLSIAQEAHAPSHSVSASSSDSLQKSFHSPLVEAELSEAEDSNRSSDFDDLVIVSEIEGSNEASCDRCPSSLSSVVQEPVDSTEQMDVTVGGSIADSQFGASCSASKSPKSHVENNLSSPITGVINSLVSAIQSNFSNTLPCSESSIIGQMNIVDSASHLVREYSSRLSDSSLPLICDSASSSQVSKNVSGIERRGNGAVISSVRQIQNTQHDAQQMMNSEMIDSDSRNGSFQNEDVFESEAMDVDVDGINTTNNLADAATCVTASNSEVMESSMEEVTGSILGEERHQTTSAKVGSGVNSTVGEASNEEGTSSLNIQENEAGTSRSSSNAEGSSKTSIVKDSVDSTSNQVFYPDKNYDNFKSTSGIDSTTNETGDRVVIVAIDSPKNLTIASSSEIPNGSIDSTLNNFKACPEEVDFEMREAKHTVEEVDVATVVIELSEVNHSIDSTSNEVRQAMNHSPRNDNVTESMAACSVGSNESVHPCEVTESCSECSVGEKVNLEHANASHQESGNLSFPTDENSSSCNVTESHIDENESLPLQQTISSNQIRDSSFVDSESCSGENVNHLVSESVPYVESGALEVTESLDGSNNVVPLPFPQEHFDTSLCEVTESCTVRKMHGMRPTHAYEEPGENRTIKLLERNAFEVPECCTSSCKSSDLAREDEQSMLDHVAELSRQIKIPPSAFGAGSSKRVESLMEIGDTPSPSAESSDVNENLVFESNTSNLSGCSISEVTESNIEAENVIIDVVADFSVDISESGPNNNEIRDVCEMDQSGDVSEQHELQMPLDNSESEVTKSFATSSSGIQHQVCDVTESKIDTENNSVKVRESLKFKSMSDVESCASTSEQYIKCEVTKSDEGLMYIVTEPPEENDSEVTASCSSNSNRYPAYDITESEAEIKQSFHYVLAEPSEIDNARHSEPCVSSNGQSAVSESESIIYIVSELDETIATDSYPSSSKEVSESNIDVEEVIYVAADSPETGTINDPCSSSSSKPSFVLDSVSEMEIEDNNLDMVTESAGQRSSEVSESCSSSGNHHGAASSHVEFLHIVTEPSGENEAEVTESCKFPRRSIYDIAESNAEDEEDILYIITESPDAGEEVSESCASSSKRCESNANSSQLIDRTTEYSEQNSMEVTESCGNSGESIFNRVTESESEINPHVNSAALSVHSHGHPSSHSDMDSSVYLVSDSTNVFNPASECVSEIIEVSAEVEDDDDSSCEVTESYIRESTCSHDALLVSGCQNTLPNLPGESSTFEAAESSMSSKKVTSTASTEPSSSYINVSSASDSAGRSVTSVIVSSANNVSRSYQDAGGDMSHSEANAPSASEQRVVSHNTSERPAENEVSDSFEQNPADSTGDNSSASHSRQYIEQPSEGFDNSKLPSSTSN